MSKGKAEITTTPYKGAYLPDGVHGTFNGKEEDNVVVKSSSWQKRILSKPCLKVAGVKTEGFQKGYPVTNIIDQNDRSWWFAQEDILPQTVVLDLGEKTYVEASRIVSKRQFILPT